MRFLRADQKQQSVNACKELRQIASDDANFLSRVINGDEIWIHSYDSDEKQKSFQWKMKSKVKRMIITFFDTARGLFTKNLSWQIK
jgi:hypothetical protein